MSRDRLAAACLILHCCAFGRMACADETAAVRATSDAFVAAFDKGDAQAVAALWTVDGQLVDEAGQVYSGRPAIAAAYAKFFQEHPGVKIKVAIDSVRMLNDGAAMEVGHASLEPVPANAAGSAKYTAMHVRVDGKWLMASVHEVSDATPTTSSNLASLDWLVGKWTGEERGATTEVVCRWLPNKTFLERRYSVTAADKSTTSGVQLIGLNPRTRQIISWGFNSDGGQSIGTWLSQEGGWAIDAVGLRPDGADTHAINLLTKLDDDAYAWRSVGRNVAGQPRPDTDEIVLKRSAPANAAK